MSGRGPPSTSLAGPNAGELGRVSGGAADERWVAILRVRLAPPQGDARPKGDGMVDGMATKKVTVTLDETQLLRIRALVEAGSARSVSGFVQHAVEVSLDDVAGWGALLAEALGATGGTLSEDERAWADGILGGSPAASSAA
ncbi:MAG: hypothetical protein QOI56_1654 [Actinomycetota bacterium]|nr:hypothetical protein [Actinomycetota bacterium]